MTCPARLLAVAFFGLYLSAAAQPASLRVVDAWIQEGPPGIPVLAGYLTLENPTADTLRVMNVSSPIAERVEIHRTDITDMTATMTRVAELPLPPKGRVAFTPGGYHLMIFGVDEPPRAGARVPLELILDTGEKILVQATVRRDAEVDSGAEEGHHHHDDHP
jgi:copper(I)-binding protein